MRTRTVAALALVSIIATPGVARRKTADAVDAANQAKNAFHDQNGPMQRGPVRSSVANRSFKVVVQAILDDGDLAIQTPDGRPMGTLDPLTIPEIIAGDRSSFGGRKLLLPSDLQAGHRLKIVVDGRTAEILRAKVLRDRGD